MVTLFAGFLLMGKGHRGNRVSTLDTARASGYSASDLRKINDVADKQAGIGANNQSVRYGLQHYLLCRSEAVAWAEKALQRLARASQGQDYVDLDPVVSRYFSCAANDET